MSEAYPFESDDDLEITELDLESVDTFGDARITVGQLVSEHESWRFGHVIVDEAQDLTPMEWRMVMRRAKARSITVVGDAAQTTRGQAGSWYDRLPAELAFITRQDLTINYRSPAEINEVASAVLASIAPDVTPSVALRTSGEPVRRLEVADAEKALPGLVNELAAAHPGRIGVVVARPDRLERFELPHDEVVVLSPANAKGLEFDTVVVVEPAAIVDLDRGDAHLYVALTRATRRLIVLHAQPLPAILAPALASASS